MDDSREGAALGFGTCEPLRRGQWMVGDVLCAPEAARISHLAKTVRTYGVSEN